MKKLLTAFCAGLLVITACSAAEQQEAKTVVTVVLTDAQRACAESAAAANVDPAFAEEVAFVCQLTGTLVPAVEQILLHPPADAGVGG